MSAKRPDFSNEFSSPNHWEWCWNEKNSSLKVWFVYERSSPYICLYILYVFVYNLWNLFFFSSRIKYNLYESFVSPPIWLFAVIFLLFNTHGKYQRKKNFKFLFKMSMLEKLMVFMVDQELILYYTYMVNFLHFFFNLIFLWSTGWKSYLWLPFVPLIVSSCELAC